MEEPKYSSCGWDLAREPNVVNGACLGLLPEVDQKDPAPVDLDQ
jgi:hypothetical protein